MRTTVPASVTGPDRPAADVGGALDGDGDPVAAARVLAEVVDAGVDEEFPVAAVVCLLLLHPDRANAAAAAAAATQITAGASEGDRRTETPEWAEQ